MKQTVIVKVTRPDSVFVDNDPELRQEIINADSCCVVLSEAVCRAILSEQLTLVDLSVKEKITSALDFKSLDRKAMCDLTGEKFDSKLKNNELVQKCKDFVIDLMSSKEVGKEK